jgi:hypothetical protein
VNPDEVFINLVEVQREKWSFERVSGRLFLRGVLWLIAGSADRLRDLRAPARCQGRDRGLGRRRGDAMIAPDLSASGGVVARPPHGERLTVGILDSNHSRTCQSVVTTTSKLGLGVIRLI